MRSRPKIPAAFGAALEIRNPRPLSNANLTGPETRSAPFAVSPNFLEIKNLRFESVSDFEVFGGAQRGRKTPRPDAARARVYPVVSDHVKLNCTDFRGVRRRRTRCPRRPFFDEPHDRYVILMTLSANTTVALTSFNKPFDEKYVKE